MFKKICTLLIRVLVSIFSLAIMFFMVKGEFFEGIAHLKNTNLLLLLLAVLINFLSLVIVTFRLKTIMSIQKLKIGFARLYYLWSISFFFNLFLPSAVGGDIAKAYYIAKDTGKKIASATAVLLDRFFGLLATVSIGFTAYLLGRGHIADPRIGEAIFLITGIAIIGTLFIMSRRFSKPAKLLLLKFAPQKLKEVITRLFEALDVYRSHKSYFLTLFLTSLLAQAAFILMVYVLAQSIHIHLPITIFFLFMPLITMISMLPSIGGLGVREAATVYLFKDYVTLDQAVALSLIFDFFVYGIGFACGILYAIRGGASIDEIERIENISVKADS